MIILAIYIAVCVHTCLSIERVFYIAAVKEEWDYAPKGNLIYSGNPIDTDIYLKLDPTIPLPGTKFKKTLYRQFTDATFTKRSKDPKWLGMIGPLIKAEIGDTIIIHFQNQAEFPYSIHPHGVFYNKDTEGAMYADGTSGKDKLDDAVKPGDNYTYIWSVRPEYGPKDNDPNCLSWLYHSHDMAEVEVMTGAVGIFATCKKGILDKEGNRYDVDKEFSVLFSIMDENFSQYRKENIEAVGITEKAIIENFMTFQLGNRKHSINGYIYGNLQGLDVCLGDKVSLNIAVVGNDLDVHSVYVQGQTMEIYKHTTDTVGLYPGSSVTANIDAENVGKWLLSCQSRDYLKAGMQAFFNVKKCNNGKSLAKTHHSQLKGKVRTYYIAAEEVIWNYAPSGIDHQTGIPLTIKANNSFGHSKENLCRLNGKYKKVIYRGYSDSKFKNPIKRPSSREHLGFLGPIIKAEVGDTIKVHFLNKASRPYSIQAYRYFITEEEQGTKYKDGPNVGVAPNKKRIYTWTVPSHVGPRKHDAGCLFGRYYSAVDQVKDTFSGLNGPLLICKKGALNCDKIHRRFYLLFSNVRETESHYWKENVERACGKKINANEFAKTHEDANNMRSINGYTYANLPGLKMREGERIVWYVTSAGYGKGDMHVPYFHGNTFQTDGIRKDTFPLIPDLFKTLIMNVDNPGKWLIEDVVHVYSNEKGMSALYHVEKALTVKKPKKEKIGKTRTYFIGAVEEEWDYYPNITHQPVSGLPLDEDPYSKVFYVQGDHTIGHIYKKAMYREFTDETFTSQKVRSERELHMGIVGPFIKAEVGDTIKVIFKNFAKFNYSIQPHGIFYNKSNEGKEYKDGTSPKEKKGDSVGPGKTHVYEWSVPARAGPSYDDFQCIFWPYMSGVNEYPDQLAGLIGSIVICRRGTLDEDNMRRDVDREFILFYNIFNENASPYLDENIRKYTNKPEETLLLKTTPAWIETNIMMSVNGYSFASIRHVDMFLGETAAFYLVGNGDPFQLHTIHWHGNTFIRRLTGPHRHDVMDIVPGDFDQVEVLGVNVGDWLMHCHVGNHSETGMLMTYRVLDPDVVLRPDD